MRICEYGERTLQDRSKVFLSGLSELDIIEKSLDHPHDSMNPNARVAILKCESYEPERVTDTISQGIEMIGGVGEFVRAGEKILIKPNLISPDLPESATITHPVFFEAVARILLDEGVHVHYGDSPGIHPPVRALKRSGIQEIAQSLGLTQADFTTRQRVHASAARQNRVFEIAKGVLDVDGIVSLPKLKTHGFMLMTGAIKNQFGCIPGLLKSGFHAKLEDVDSFSQMLVDLNLFLKPRLFIMDGVLAMEGNGPRRGNPVDLGVIMVSADPVALDTVAAGVIGLNPRKIPLLMRGQESGLGTMENIHTIGVKIEDVKKKFDLPRYSGNFKSIPPFIRNILKRFMAQLPVIARDKCIKCHECHKICPTRPKSIVIRDDDFPEHDYRYCIRCYCCQETCPTGAISIRTKLF
jgi:uncharacterized protein (DUF362 family)/Pyruvate/2-oxoacid:ferredoxin oxidoreductase delta subunit